MKRHAHLMPRICTWENLALAFHKAAAGKRRSAAVIRFEANLPHELNTPVAELESGTWQPGAFHRFLVRDPKLRVIHAARCTRRHVFFLNGFAGAAGRFGSRLASGKLQRAGAVQDASRRSGLVLRSRVSVLDCAGPPALSRAGAVDLFGSRRVCGGGRAFRGETAFTIPPAKTNSKGLLNREGQGHAAAYRKR